MTYIYKGKHGRYAVMSAAAGRIYEMDGSDMTPPVAGFTDASDLKEYLRWKNKETLQCAPDCKYNDGSRNEDRCDFCLRKGNISDYYTPCDGRGERK